MRDRIMLFRCSLKEANELYRYARARSATMSYMIREALKDKYPDIFGNANRHIRKPRKPKPLDGSTSVMVSLANNDVRVVDTQEFLGTTNEREDS